MFFLSDSHVYQCEMSFFINNIPVSINFFAPFTPSSLDKPPVVVSIQLDFENRLIQFNWTFTLGLGLVLNNASIFFWYHHVIYQYMLR